MRTIFGYLDYRQYLRDYYEEKKSAGKISLRIFSQKAGFTAPNYLKLVMDGERNLSPASVRKFIKALSLAKDEAEFFTNLVFMNQAESHEEKNHYYQRLSKISRYLEVKHVEKDQYEFFSKWYYAAIREITILPGFVEDPTWIAKALIPAIAPGQARDAIDLLLRLGLIVRDGEGKLRPSDRAISGGNEVTFLASCNFHIQMLKRAAEYVARSKQTTREFSSLTIALSSEKFKIAKRRIQEFRRELHALLADCDDSNSVYQLNLQLFPLVEAPDETA